MISRCLVSEFLRRCLSFEFCLAIQTAAQAGTKSTSKTHVVGLVVVVIVMLIRMLSLIYNDYWRSRLWLLRVTCRLSVARLRIAWLLWITGLTWWVVARLRLSLWVASLRRVGTVRLLWVLRRGAVITVLAWISHGVCEKERKKEEEGSENEREDSAKR
ncbi:MAG: hypothetical protein J3Q66DRAFT_334870 [Benniella sp.]|nr:MAG: hypothetical protein J3Q66DRAFT_334870 [Benniella sp.]